MSFAAFGDLSLASGTYPALAGAVFFGSVIPVLPTGAVVSAGAAVAVHSHSRSLLLVVLVCTFAALAGDLLSYVLFLAGGGLVTRRLSGDAARLDVLRDKLARHDVLVLVTSRLVPAGRIPVLIAAAVVKYPLRRYLPVGTLAALTWAIAYAALGVLGGQWFTDPWTSAGVAIALALLIAVGPRLLKFLRLRRS